MVRQAALAMRSARTKSVLGLVVIMSAFTLYILPIIMAPVLAQTIDPNTQQKIQDGLKTAPKELSADDLGKAQQIALADALVQNYIAGRPYYLSSYTFYGNVYENPAPTWLPSLDFYIDNKDQVVVLVDLSKGTVEDVKFYPNSVVKLPQAVEKPKDDTSSPSSQLPAFDNPIMLGGLLSVLIGSGLVVALALHLKKLKTEAKLKKLS